MPPKCRFCKAQLAAGESFAEHNPQCSRPPKATAADARDAGGAKGAPGKANDGGWKRVGGRGSASGRGGRGGAPSATAGRGAGASVERGGRGARARGDDRGRGGRGSDARGGRGGYRSEDTPGRGRGRGRAPLPLSSNTPTTATAPPPSSDLPTRLLRAEGLLPARSGRVTAAGRLAAMCFFHLCEIAPDGTARLPPVPSDVPQTVIGALTKAECQWKFCYRSDDSDAPPEFPSFGSAFVFFHASRRMAILFYNGGNGWFKAVHRGTGVCTVMSNPGPNDRCTGRNNSELFAALKALEPAMFEITEGCRLPEQKGPTPCEVHWDPDDGAAPVAGAEAGPSFTVSQVTEVKGPPLRVFANGAVRLTSGSSGFRMFLDDAPPP